MNKNYTHVYMVSYSLDINRLLNNADRNFPDYKNITIITNNWKFSKICYFWCHCEIIIPVRTGIIRQHSFFCLFDHLST